ncbi:uncharacterized protein MELLADRAFT_52121 [Melampsora larici-populina 98AG31]|uniref:Uncharacterized protein n=1 Tax=Melampsora larici-populina (strain 98AG31 / pathotype 3-4-7) TaxID=747676 RepID=F4RFR4_MELLP|nr:uncharacterized protein MELLADRAFT_52121 [Melampsora larici-populina 98AG31]EGG08855.1 hypothetical protein MELLADRAFT_52121 [Melampsora larici-populina 98AG31]
MVKRLAEDVDEEWYQQLIVSIDGTGKVQSNQSVMRVLSGHNIEVLYVKFDLGGDHLVAASTDFNINLCAFYEEDFKNYTPLKLLEDIVVIMESNSCNLIASNSCDLIASGLDDETVVSWCEDETHALDKVDLNHPSDVVWSTDGQQLFIGAIDNDVHYYDLQKKQVSWSLCAHTDTIPGLRLSPDGSVYLVLPCVIHYFLITSTFMGSHLIDHLPFGIIIGHKGTFTSELHPKESINASGGLHRQLFLVEMD